MRLKVVCLIEQEVIDVVLCDWLMGKTCLDHISLAAHMVCKC